MDRLSAFIPAARHWMLASLLTLGVAELSTAVGGAAGAAITRGPYLQQGTSTSVIVRWRTDLATDSRVSFGTSPSTLTSSATNIPQTTEHEVRLTGLTPDTQY